MATHTRSATVQAATDTAPARTPRARRAPAKQPAKKAPAKKTAPKKTAVKAAAKKTAKKPPPPLPTRPTDWMTDAQGFAVLAARLAGITTPHIQDWQTTTGNTDTAVRRMPDGSHLHYNLATRTLTWQALCPMGAIHEYVLGSPSTNLAARLHADRCTTPHYDMSLIKPLTADELEALGLLQTPTWARPDILGEHITATHLVPVPAKPRTLGDQLTHANTTNADTQPIPALTETAKEHPQP